MLCRWPDQYSPATPTAHPLPAPACARLQLQQLEGRLAPEEKAIKARSLDFSNRIFGAGQVRPCWPRAADAPGGGSGGKCNEETGPSAALPCLKPMSDLPAS